MSQPKTNLSTLLLPSFEDHSDYRSGKPAGTATRIPQNLYHQISRSRHERRTDVRSKVDVIIWDLTGYFRGDAGAIMGGPFSKNGKFENQTIKDRKSKNLRTINLYRSRGTNPHSGEKILRKSCDWVGIVLAAGFNLGRIHVSLNFGCATKKLLAAVMEV